MKRILLNKIYIAKLATNCTTGLFAVLGFMGTFVSLNDVLAESISLKGRIAISIIVLIFVWLTFFIVCAFYVCRMTCVEILKLNGNHHVYIQYGDIFSENEVANPQERRNIVIPVNRCFDTEVDNDLISLSSLHGIAMNRLYNENIFDSVSLNNAIQHNLNVQQLNYDNILSENKRKGNLKRFPVGTVAEIKISDQCTYFFMGLSKFDENLKASTTDDEYVLALMRLLEFCNTRSQQFPVIMPLIGAGLSRTQKSEKDILKYIIGLIKMNKTLINYDLHIVIRNTEEETIAITDLL